MEDVPPLADLATAVTALLAAFQHLARDAAMVRQLLVASPAGLCTHPLGRQALRQVRATSRTHPRAAAAAAVKHAPPG